MTPPECIPSPFNNQPHALAVAAAEHLQQRLPQLTAGVHDVNAPDGGKMLGVLVVVTSDHQLAYLAAFSGMLGGSWTVDGFVSPVFEVPKYTALLQRGQVTLDSIAGQKRGILTDNSYLEAVARQACVQQKTEKAIAENKKSHAQRKQHRAGQRATHADNPTLLSELNKQSRSDKRAKKQLQREIEKQLAEVDQPVAQYKNALQQLDSRRRQYSATLQRRLFDEYTIRSVGSSSVSLRSLFHEKLPPSGAGDCAAVKLLNAAILQQLTPVCLAEFWWGAALGLRQHGRFYPACRGKCRPILPHMLTGLAVALPVFESALEFSSDEPAVVFEDDTFIVVNKPSGMLSVPGHAIIDSVETRLRHRFPVTSNQTLLLHRLDQPTSGLMVAAKNAQAHKHLHLQFQQRRVQKRYLANLAGTNIPASGEINLPLRVDIDDRPRQLVCHKHGKPALTRYRVLQVRANTTLVEFIPVTGRTHQLRVHAAHPLGLNTPIVGDELYGQSANRLHLHAQALAFTHPVTGEAKSFCVQAPFVVQNPSEAGM